MVNILPVGALTLALGLFVSACTTDIESARKLILNGEDFTLLLAENYRDLAIFEADRMYDWPDASRYAQKALAASKGVPPPPESLADWHLPAEQVPVLGRARAHLIAAFEAGFALTDPAQAATAQSSFDCWVEQLEEGWQTSHIKECRDAFEAALGTWRARQIKVSSIAALRPKSAANAGDGEAPEKDHAARRRHSVCEFGVRAEEASSAATAMEVEPAALRIRVQFAHDSATLDGLGSEAVENGARLARAPGVAEVFIEGHADSIGMADYNLGLSLRRAEAVWRRLIENGVSAAKLWLGPRGETQPEIATADGTGLAANRRITLLLVEALPGELISTEPCAEINHPSDAAS